MCGRYVQIKRRRDYEAYLKATRRDPAAEIERPSWNVPPSASSWVARSMDGELIIDRLTSGIPGPVSGTSTLISNARIETASTKRMFSEAWRARHCIVPVEGWYEWKPTAGAKQPFYFTLPTGDPVLLAGLWEGDRFVVLTSETAGPLRGVHPRRPVALKPDAAQRWLSGVQMLPEDVLGELEAEEAFQVIPVSSAVNSTRNDGAQLVEPKIATANLAQSLLNL